MDPSGALRIASAGRPADVVSAAGQNRTFGDLCLTPAGDVMAVREESAEHTIVLVGGEPPTVTVVAEGSDFYLSPRASPDGRWLAYLSWAQPDLAWHAAELFLVRMTDIGAPAVRWCGLPGVVREIS